MRQSEFQQPSAAGSVGVPGPRRASARNRHLKDVLGKKAVARNADRTATHGNALHRYTCLILAACVVAGAAGLSNSQAILA